ncbi:unnamed protein product [Prunus brigantina]
MSLKTLPGHKGKGSNPLQKGQGHGALFSSNELIRLNNRHMTCLACSNIFGSFQAFQPQPPPYFSLQHTYNLLPTFSSDQQTIVSASNPHQQIHTISSSVIKVVKLDSVKATRLFLCILSSTTISSLLREIDEHQQHQKVGTLANRVGGFSEEGLFSVESPCLK